MGIMMYVDASVRDCHHSRNLSLARANDREANPRQKRVAACITRKEVHAVCTATAAIRLQRNVGAIYNLEAAYTTRTRLLACFL